MNSFSSCSGSIFAPGLLLLHPQDLKTERENETPSRIRALKHQVGPRQLWTPSLRLPRRSGSLPSQNSRPVINMSSSSAKFGPRGFQSSTLVPARCDHLPKVSFVASQGRSAPFLSQDKQILPHTHTPPAEPQMSRPPTEISAVIRQKHTRISD